MKYLVVVVVAVVIIYFWFNRKTTYTTKYHENKTRKGYSNKTIYVMTCKKLNILKYCIIKVKCIVTAS